MTGSFLPTYANEKKHLDVAGIKPRPPVIASGLFILYSWPLRHQNVLTEIDFSFFPRRKVDRLIIHKNFQSEALSWKGYDLALMHLTQEYGDEATENLQIVPVCLVTMKYFCYSSLLCSQLGLLGKIFGEIFLL